MMGERYLDKDALRAASVAYLKEMKEKHSLSTIFDCTPVNIGRDINLLRRVSEDIGRLLTVDNPARAIQAK